MSKMNDRKLYRLGSDRYTQKAVPNELVRATEKVQKMLQREANLKLGKNAPTVSFAYAQLYIYENYIKGKNIE